MEIRAVFLKSTILRLSEINLFVSTPAVPLNTFLTLADLLFIMSKSTSFSTHSQVEGKPLLGKAGIVTGAGTGIGKSIAIRLAELG